MRLKVAVLSHVILLVIFGREERLPCRTKVSNMWKIMEVFKGCSPWRNTSDRFSEYEYLLALVAYSDRVRQFLFRHGDSDIDVGLI